MRKYDRATGYNGTQFRIALPAKAVRVADAAVFGLSADREDNSFALDEAFAYCRKNSRTRLSIPRGVYRFGCEAPLTLDGARDILIEGNGSEFIFSGGGFIRFAACDAVQLQNLYLDWDWGKNRLASLARVTGVAPDKSYVDFVFPELKEADPDIRWRTINQFDPVTLTPGLKDGKEYWDELSFYKVEKLAQNALRVYHNGCLNELKTGEVYLVRHETYGTNAVELTGCSNISIKDVTIYSAPGMGFVAGKGTHHFQLYACKITLRPGAADRRVSTTADAVHISDTNGFARIEKCDFSFMGDDAVNIHDNIAVIASVTDGNACVINEWMDCRAGDTIGVKRDDFTDTGIEMTVADITEYGGRKRALRFEEALPEDIGAGCVLYNKKYNSANYVIKNNYFHENRARGLLLQSGNGLVEGNRFYKTQGAAILVLVDVLSGKWAEGTGVENLMIRGNVFENCDVNDWTALIGFKVTLPSGKICRSVFKEVVFEKNSFVGYPCRCFYISSAENIRIQANSFINSLPDNDADTLSQSILAEHSEGVLVNGNGFSKTQAGE